MDEIHSLRIRGGGNKYKEGKKGKKKKKKEEEEEEGGRRRKEERKGRHRICERSANCVKEGNSQSFT